MHSSLFTMIILFLQIEGTAARTHCQIWVEVFKVFLSAVIGNFDRPLILC